MHLRLLTGWFLSGPRHRLAPGLHTAELDPAELSKMPISMLRKIMALGDGMEIRYCADGCPVAGEQ